MNNLNDDHQIQGKAHNYLRQIQQSCDHAISVIKQAFQQRKSFKFDNAHTVDIYNIVYNAVENDWKAEPFGIEKVKLVKVEEHIIQIYQGCISRYLMDMISDEESEKDDPEQVLEKFQKEYQNFKIFTRWLVSVFNYIDKFHQKVTQDNLYTGAFKQMKVIVCSLIKQKYFESQMGLFQRTIFTILNKFRQYQSHPPKNLSKLIQLFLDINSNSVVLQKSQTGEYNFTNQGGYQSVNKFYQDHFENPYLDELEKYYQKQCYEWMQLTTPEYVQKASQALIQEKLLIDEFYPRSEIAVTNKLMLIMVGDLGQAVIEQQGSGVSMMLHNERNQQLKDLYHLMKDIPENVSSISKILISYLEGIGSSINLSEQDQKKQAQLPQGRLINIAEIYVEEILALMEKGDHLVQDVFSNDMKMKEAYKTAFSNILNKNEKSSQYLSIYCDIFLKNDKIASEVEIQNKMNLIIKVFQCIYQRDVFFEYHQKQMSIRLLSGQYKNKDAERQLIQKFKVDAGTNAVTNLQTMLNDVNLSEEFNSSIKSVITQITKYDFSAQILTQRCWPFVTISEQIIPPSQMQDILYEYEKRYLTKYSGRQLIWCLNQGIGEVVFKTTKERYFLGLSTIQIIAFLQFNQDEMMSVSEIIRKTGITKYDLESALIPLVVIKIIKRVKADLDEFDGHEYLTLQMDFWNKQKKLRMPPNPRMAPKRQQEQKQLSAEEIQQFDQLMEEREFIVDSQLIRVMKSRKQLKHHELVLDCTKMINLFKPDVNFIKQRIESLIEKEYLHRDETDWNIYNYVN